MSMWRVLSVGLWELTTSIVGLLSSQIGVGPACLNPSSARTDLTCFAVFEAVTAAVNSASVELSAASDCVLDLQTVGPPECVNT